MNIVLEVANELLGMFWADARITTTTLVLVALTAVLMIGLHASPVMGGGLLLVGCLLTFIEATIRGARHPEAAN